MVPGILKLRAWMFPLFTTDIRICYLTAFYLVLAGAAPSDPSGLVPMVRLLVAIGLYGAWGVLLNDYVDRELDAAAGKKTGIEGIPRYQAGILLAILPILGFVAIPDPLSRPIVPSIFAACYLMALVYSAPKGRRLKEKGAWGFIVDVILEKPLPSLALFAYFDDLGNEALVLALMYSSIGVFTLALHQIWDHDSDLAHGVRTFAVAIGRDRLLEIYKRYFVPLFLTSAMLSLAVVGLRTGPIGLLSVIVFAAAGLILLVLSLRGIVQRYDPIRPGYSSELWFVYTFFHGPLPTLLGVAVTLRSPIYLPVLVATFLSQAYMLRWHYKWAIMKMLIALRR